MNVAPQSRLDALSALFRPNQHEVVPEHLFIGLHGDRNGMFAALDSMPSRSIAGLDAGKLKRDNLMVQQRDEPPDWTNEPYAALAGPRHAFRKMDGRNDVGQLLAKCFIRSLSCYMLMKTVALPLRVLNSSELVNCRTLLFSKTFGRFRPGGQVRTLGNSLCVGRAVEQPFREQN